MGKKRPPEMRHGPDAKGAVRDTRLGGEVTAAADACRGPGVIQGWIISVIPIIAVNFSTRHYPSIRPMRASSNSYFRSRGGRRAFLRTVVFGAAARLGAAHWYRRIDWSRVRRIVFVCKGNICRSPFAEGLAKRLALPAASFGLDAESGAPAAPDAVLTATAYGVDLTLHRATSANEFELDGNDLVVGFEPSHVRRLLLKMDRSAPFQVTLLAAWSRPSNLYIHDPFGASPDYYHSCFARIDRAVQAMSRVIALHNNDVRA